MIPSEVEKVKLMRKEMRTNQTLILTRFELNESFLYIKSELACKDIIESDIVGFCLLISSGKSEKKIPLRWNTNNNEQKIFIEGEVNLFNIENEIPLGNIKCYFKFQVLLSEDGNNHTRFLSWNMSRDIAGNNETNKEVKRFSATLNEIINIQLTTDNNELKLRMKTVSESSPIKEKTIKMDNRLMRGIKKCFFKATYNFFLITPVNEKKIAFLSDSRERLSGNFEYIYQELLLRENKFKITFHFKKTIREKKSFKELFYLAKAIASSKYVLLDDFYPMVYPLKIRKEVELIQVWHAVGAFKKFGYSRSGLPGGPKETSINHRNYTKVVISSKNIIDEYAEGFGVSKSTMIPIGVPRTDLFFDDKKKQRIRERLTKELPFIKNKKVILFAPTFRGNGQQSAFYPYGMIDFNAIYEAFKDDYVFLLKIHPFVQNKPDIDCKDFFYDVSYYREINELLLISDKLVTDYSSVCFEYALLNKQMVFFSPDIEEYTSNRDFYYDYKTFIPGKLALNTEELIENLKEYKVDEEKLDEFKKYFYDELNGQASKRFVDALLEYDFK